MRSKLHIKQINGNQKHNLGFFRETPILSLFLQLADEKMNGKCGMKSRYHKLDYQLYE